MSHIPPPPVSPYLSPKDQLNRLSSQKLQPRPGPLRWHPQGHVPPSHLHMDIQMPWGGVGWEPGGCLHCGHPITQVATGLVIVVSECMGI